MIELAGLIGACCLCIWPLTYLPTSWLRLGRGAVLFAALALIGSYLIGGVDAWIRSWWLVVLVVLLASLLARAMAWEARHNAYARWQMRARGAGAPE